MRCLSLADELHRSGAICQFLCREEPGHLMREIVEKGYPVHSLTAPGEIDHPTLEIDEIADSERTSAFLSGSPVVVVDHYSMGELWETRVRSDGRYVMAIDDLANRSHNCNVLVDHNLGRVTEHYKEFVPPGCQLLVGPSYALLRLEFSQWRGYSLRRRSAAPQLQRLFISMGGVDQLNVTNRILAALHHCRLPAECRITVVLGRTSPWVNEVEQTAKGLPWATDVLVGTNCIAELMANSDLAIGASGGTSWERCSLGLPALIVVVAENQQAGASALFRANAARDLGGLDRLSERLPEALSALGQPGLLAAMSGAAGRLVDGLGVQRVCRQLEEVLEQS